MSRMLALACMLAAFALAAGSASAQQPSGTSQQPAPTPPYGPPITLEQAKRVMAAAELEAAKNSWQVAVTILDSGGNLVTFHKLDNTQLASIGVSRARPTRRCDSSVRARRSTTSSPPAAPGCACLPSRTSRRSRAASPSSSTAQSSARSASPARSPRRTRRWRGRAQRR